MKLAEAWRCQSYGSPTDLRLQALPLSIVAADRVRVEIHAIGINFLDLVMTRGMPGISPLPPFTPGVEAAGVVAEVGADVSGIKVGTPVFVFSAEGAFASVIDVSSDRLLPLPAGVDFAVAAATGICFGTSYYALCRRAGGIEGQTVAILGATGATGLAAVSIASALNAKVIAIGGEVTKLEFARKAGADLLLNYQKGVLDIELMQMTNNQGVDVIFDTVAGPALDHALRSLRSGGKVICVGATSGSPAMIDHMTIVTKNIDVIGISFGAFRQLNPAFWRQHMTDLFDRLNHRNFYLPSYHTYSFKELPQALLDLQSRKLRGKAVVIKT